MVSVTLIYEDGSTWFAGEFSSQEKAQTWIDEERTRPYWNSSTQVQIQILEMPVRPTINFT